MIKTEVEIRKEFAADLVMVLNTAYEAGLKGEPKDYRSVCMEYIEENPDLSPDALNLLDKITKLSIAEYERGVRRGSRQ